MKPSPALLILFAFFIGLTIGAIGSAVFLGGHVATNFELHNLSFLASLEEKTEDAYRHEPPAVAAWALNRLIELQQSLLVQSEPGQAAQLSRNLVASYGRLALTYQKMGRDELYHRNIAQALQRAQKVSSLKISTEQDLLEFIRRLDRPGP